MKTTAFFLFFICLLIVVPSHLASATTFSFYSDIFLGTCATPTPIACGNIISDNTANGQSNIDEYGADLSTGAELVYELMPTTDVDAIIELTNLVADVDVFVFTDCTDPKNSTIASSIKGGTTAELITIGLSSGTSYFISVDGFAGNSSTFDLSVTCTPIVSPCGAGGAFFEDFEGGQPNGWTFNVTGASANAVWNFDANNIGSGNSITNPGSGNWASYDDDAAGNSGDLNTATATTSTLDLSILTDIVLSFDYNYRELNDEAVTLSVTDGTTTFFWNGSVWTNTMTAWLSLSSEMGTFSQLIPNSLTKSNLSFTLEYSDVDAAWAEGFGFDNFGLCEDSGNSGSNCPVSLMVDANPISSDTYAAANTITSSGTVNGGSTVIFEAGQSVTLQAGFHAQANSEFVARIQNCVATANQTIEQRTQHTTPTNHTRVYPNPFKEQSTIEVELSKSEEVQIDLFDLSGRHLSTILSKQYIPSGKHTFELPSHTLTAGMYVIIVRIDQHIETLKVTRIN